MNPDHQEPSAIRKIQLWIIVAQCGGMIAHVFIQNNFLLLYFLRLGISDRMTFVLLSATAFLQVLMAIPGSLACERFGAKRIGLPGNLMVVLGFGLFIVIPEGSPATVLCACLGVAIYTAGNAMHRAGWFALIDPAIPVAERGRFLARMRFWFMLVGIGFSFVAGTLLGEGSLTAPYRVFLLAITLVLMVRLIAYGNIPEVMSEPLRIREALREIPAALGRHPAFVRFCLFVFLITLFSDGAHAIFGMVERNRFGYPAAIVSHLGNSMLIGMLAGFLVGGRLTDRIGTRLPFRLSVAAYLLSLSSFLILSRLLPPHPALMALPHVAYGFTRGFFSIALTHEMLRLAPRNLMSISTTLNLSMASLGGGLSLLIAGMLYGISMELPGTTFLPGDFILTAMLAGLLVTVLSLGWDGSQKAESLPGLKD